MNKPTQSLVVSYSIDSQSLVAFTMDEEKIKAIPARIFPIDIPLEEYGFKVDDKFAAQFGAAVLNLLALSHPDLKAKMSLTPHPDSR